MPAIIAPTKDDEKVRHEEFCQPQPGSDEVRMETFSFLSEDPESGRERPSHRVTRCVECGAAHYKKI